MSMNGNNWHPYFGGFRSDTHVHPRSMAALMVWVGGLVFAAFPLAFGVGTTIEYIDKTSDVPFFVPVLCFTVTAASVYATKKAADGLLQKKKKAKTRGLQR